MSMQEQSRVEANHCTTFPINRLLDGLYVNHVNVLAQILHKSFPRGQSVRIPFERESRVLTNEGRPNQEKVIKTVS